MTIVACIHAKRNKALEHGKEVTHVFVGPSDDRKLCSYLSDCDIVVDSADGHTVWGLYIVVTKRELLEVGTIY